VARAALAQLEARLDAAAAVEPAEVSRARVIEQLRAKLTTLLEKGYTEQAVVDLLKPEMPGLTVAALRFYLRPRKRGKPKA
jgi:hypothetical protein